MKHLKATFLDWDCAGKAIFLRADLNVPLNNERIIDDNRLLSIEPTLKSLIKKRTRIILATHIGSPKTYERGLSTQWLVPWFSERGYAISYAKDLKEAHAMIHTLDDGSILLLENLRFFPGEKEHSQAFVDELYTMAHYYIDDAFGALHRNDSSIALLPLQFLPEKRSIGLLVQDELTLLYPLKSKPPSPFTLIMGGAKFKTKLPLIKPMLEKTDTILIGPALAFTFMKVQHKPIGKSLIDDSYISLCTDILSHAQKTKTELILPIDFQVADEEIKGPLSFTQTIKNHQVGISIGPKTVELFSKKIEDSRAVFFNGAMGFLERPETLMGINGIFTAMARMKGESFVAGGDSVAALKELNIKGIDHQIQGGGSALTYIADQELPGLIPFLENGTKTDNA